MRINGFTQIKAFYSWTFSHQEKQIKPQHISLYLFLLNQNNRNNWIEWFKCPFDLAMTGSCISSKKTYYKCLNELQEWKLIQYQKGSNNWKAPLIKIEVLKDASTVPQSEPQVLQADEPLLTLLPTHIYKLITDNIERVSKHLPQWISNLDGEPIKNDLDSNEKFLSWFNKGRTLYLEIPSNVNRLTQIDKSNLHKLKESYSKEDFNIALHNICNDKWANETNNIMPKHFLNEDNFAKYLNMEKKPLISKSKKVRLGWKI
jgi:hypothetical protein